MPKKTDRGALWDFSTSILPQNIKKLKGGPFGEKFVRKKVSQSRKKTERGTLSRYGMLHGKRGKTFLVQFARPNESIWDHKTV